MEGEIGQRRDGRTLMPTKTECVLLAIPTTTEPCLTASAAYSTWNIRPCGELWTDRGFKLAGEGGQARRIVEMLLLTM